MSVYNPAEVHVWSAGHPPLCQGCKFESALLPETLVSFDVKKSWMTAYHP